MASIRQVIRARGQEKKSFTQKSHRFRKSRCNTMLLLLTGWLHDSAGILNQEVPSRDHARAKRAMVWIKTSSGKFQVHGYGKWDVQRIVGDGPDPVMYLMTSGPMWDILDFTSGEKDGCVG